MVKTVRWFYYSSRIISGFCGTIIQWHWKTDPWSNRNHWCDHDWFQRTYVEIDKLVVQQSLSDHKCQNLHLLRLGSLCGKKWEMIRLQLRRIKLNGIRRIITSRNWIASTVCRRSSSGKHSQDSRRCASSRRFKIWWKTYSVNFSSSTTGSSSCQCTTTLRGEKKET